MYFDEMALFDRVALAIDFSDASKEAARAAFRLMELTGTEHLTVLHASHEVVLPKGDQPALRGRLKELESKIQEAAKDQISNICNELGSKCGFAVQLDSGLPKAVIPALCKRLGVSLLMMGSHSRRGIRRWLMGSVAETTLSRLGAPTLVLQAGDDGVLPTEEFSRLEHVLVAVDIEEHAEQVVRVAVEAVRAFKGVNPSVSLLAVNEDLRLPPVEGADSYQRHLDAESHRALTALKAQFEAPDLGIDVCLGHGDPADVILQTAENKNAQLIVVGSHAGGRPGELGDVIPQVLRYAKVSVLVVPSSSPGPGAAGTADVQ